MKSIIPGSVKLKKKFNPKNFLKKSYKITLLYVVRIFSLPQSLVIF
jgi:hypothetical protein